MDWYGIGCWAAIFLAVTALLGAGLVAASILLARAGIALAESPVEGLFAELLDKYPAIGFRRQGKKCHFLPEEKVVVFPAGSPEPAYQDELGASFTVAHELGHAQQLEAASWVLSLRQVMSRPLGKKLAWGMSLLEGGCYFAAAALQDINTLGIAIPLSVLGACVGIAVVLNEVDATRRGIRLVQGSSLAEHHSREEIQAMGWQIGLPALASYATLVVAHVAFVAAMVAYLI